MPHAAIASASPLLHCPHTPWVKRALLICPATILLLFFCLAWRPTVTTWGPKYMKKRQSSQLYAAGETDDHSHGDLFDYEAPSSQFVARAYRTGAEAVTAVFLRPVNRPKPTACVIGQQKSTRLQYRDLSGDVHGAPIAPMAVDCWFQPGVIGNSSSHRNSNGRSAVAALKILGMGEAREIPVWDFSRILAKPFSCTVCTPSLHGEKLRYTWLAQWMRLYVEKHGVDRVFAYVSKSSARAMREDLIANNVSYARTHLSLAGIASQMNYSTHYFAQYYGMHECLALNRHLGTEWVLFQDLDEVLSFHLPKVSLPNPATATAVAYFRSIANATALTFGRWNMQMKRCRSMPVADDIIAMSPATQHQQHWPWIAGSVREPAPACGVACLGYRGRRKYAVRPNCHFGLFIHRPLAVMSCASKMIVDVDTGSAHMLHFRGIVSAAVRYCAERSV